MVPKKVSILSLVILLTGALLAAATSVSFSQANAPDRPADAPDVFLPLVVHHWPPLVRVLPNHFGFLDEFGVARVMGEVQNDSPDMVTFVKVPVSLLDDVGQVLTTDEAGVGLFRLAPGEKSCFEVRFENPPAGFDSYQFDAPTYTKRDEVPPKLTIYGDQGSYDPSFGDYMIEGKARNDDSSRVQYVTVIVTLYDAAGTVVDCGVSFPNRRELDPGESSDFDFYAVGRDYADVASYRLQADADLE
jgi:hypothetical protein